MPLNIADVSESLSQVAENTGRSVVRVESGRRRTATGVVWSPKQIVTVARAVGDAEVVTVFGADGVERQARVKGRDASTDLALLEVDDALTPATFDDGAGLKVGQLVLRLGRPGETVRATSGIVSTVGKKAFKTPRGGEVDFFLDTDAPHQPGFSGGPLVDLAGRVVGITTTGVLRGEDLALPIKTVRRVVAQLEQHGRIRRSHLGLQLQPVRLPDDVRTNTGEEIGLLVTGVEKDGPAEKGGIQYGDTVLHLGDDTVRTLDDLYAYLRADHVDQQVPVKLYRNGQVVTQQVTLGGK
ncbi:MAG: trypsin-like peptidase domain-containing protein [Myxococcaceae bacterium]